MNKFFLKYFCCNSCNHNDYKEDDDEEEDLEDYISNHVDWTVGQSAEDLKANFEVFKIEKYNKDIADTANKHGLAVVDLKDFVEQVMDRMIFDGEKLTDLLEPLELGWKQRSKKETELMQELAPKLKKMANGREISGLAAYE